MTGCDLSVDLAYALYPSMPALPLIALPFTGRRWGQPDDPNSQIDDLLPWANIRAPELKAVI